MIKLFLSYVIKESKEQIIHDLRRYCWDNDFQVRSCDYIDFLTTKNGRLRIKIDILGSSGFIGLAMSQNEKTKFLFEDFSVAKENKIPNLLLVEKSVKLPEGVDVNDPNIIIYDKRKLAKTSEEIQKRASLENLKGKPKRDMIAWILGGDVLLKAVEFLANNQGVVQGLS